MYYKIVVININTCNPYATQQACVCYFICSNKKRHLIHVHKLYIGY